MSADIGMAQLLLPSEAMYIDRKLDDGKPISGNVVSGNGCTDSSFNCPTTCIDDDNSANRYINIDPSYANKACYIAFFVAS